MADFFGKLSDGINKGIAKVGANSKALMEKAKIKTVIDKAENERKQLTQLLGTKIHDMYKTNGEIVLDDGMKNIFAEIDKREEVIAQQQEQLKKIEEELRLVAGGTAPIEGGITCTCGHINARDTKFCAKCGSQQQAPPPAPAAEVQQGVTCACGHINSEDTKFCANCGSPQQAAPIPPQPAPPQPVIPQGITCSCGHVNPVDMKFCAKCGTPQQAAPIPAPPEPSAPQGITCSCGHVNPVGMKFCVSCGSSL